MRALNVKKRDEKGKKKEKVIFRKRAKERKKKKTTIWNIDHLDIEQSLSGGPFSSRKPLIVVK